MAHFPNAYKTLFVFSAPVFKETPGKTDALTAEEFGCFDPVTWQVIDTAGASVNTHGSFVLAKGSNHQKDKFGSHGGYQESIKSKPINPRYIHRFYKVVGRSAANQVISLGYDEANAATAPTFTKGKQYLLRLDLKGSPALRFFGRNLYHTFDASTGCVDDTCADPCGPEALVDPVTVLLQWAVQIKTDPIFSQFILPAVFYNAGAGTVAVNADTYVPVTTDALITARKAWIELQVAYIDTKFGNCSFDPRDHYEMEPLKILASLVDESGDPCKIPYLSVREKQAARTAEGVGETILREQILSNRYRQEHFQVDTRRREIEEGDAATLGLINRNGQYDSYYLLYSVPRHSNPSGTLDADQYLLQISVPHGADLSDFTTWMQTYLQSAGTGVKLEDLSSAP